MRVREGEGENREAGGRYAEMKMMWRSQLRAMLLLRSPSLHPLTALLTVSCGSSRPPLSALHKTLSFHLYSSFSSPPLFHSPVPSAFVVPVRCLSSIFPATALDWNQPVSGSEVTTDADGGGRSLGEEDSRRSIPVRAYFFSTRFVLVYFSFFLFFLLFFWRRAVWLVGKCGKGRRLVAWSGSMGW